jgi:hypothetical protein
MDRALYVKAMTASELTGKSPQLLLFGSFQRAHGHLMRGLSLEISEHIDAIRSLLDEADEENVKQ